MEQPPGSLDDLQPQDLSSSGIPTVIDLTKKSEECALNSTSLDALRVGKSPGWYPNSGTGDPGLPSPETGSSDVTLQSGDGIQPDNAFSHTTVTLSYVSRSHVFPTRDSLSRRSPLYSVSPTSKFSLHAARESEKGLGETGYTLNQHYEEHVDRPVDLAAQTELFQSLSQAQAAPEDSVCLTQQPHEFNGGVVSGDGGEEEHSLSRNSENNSVLENEQGDSWSSSGVCTESSPETPTPVTGEDEVLFLMSKKQDPVIIPNIVGARDLCSLSREYISPLEDPVSPSATSLDDVEDVFILPQASSSPSGDTSLLETADGVTPDGSTTEGAIQLNSSISGITTRLDSSEEHKQPIHRRKATLEPLIDLTDDVCLSDVSEEKPQTVIPHMNGNAKALQRTLLKEKKLPMRIGRGTRLEAIVMNINSSRYKVSGCIRTSKNTKPSQASSSVSPKKKKKAAVLSAGKKKSKAKSSKIKQKSVTPLKGGKTNSINTDSSKDSTSDCEIINNSKKSHSSTPPKSPSVHKRSKKEPEDGPQAGHLPQSSPARAKRKPSAASSPQNAAHKNSKKEPEPVSHPDPSLETQPAKFSPPQTPTKSPKKKQATAKNAAAGRKTPPTAKTKASRTPKRRRKKSAGMQLSSMFAPKEPEIKLRYVNYKEERRDSRSDGFSPFIRVHREQPTLCAVVNYPEEVRTPPRRGQQLQQQEGHMGGFNSAAVPTTSCLQLGRVSTHSQHRRSLVCCLCGRAANAMDLGDLHGPYYPEGYRPSAKTPASTSGLKEDADYSDSDSSSCSVRGRGRKGAVTPKPWSRAPPKQKGIPGGQRWSGDGGSPAAKRARTDSCAADVEDWYSPPVLPLEPCEYWLHEDCGIWSAGVFLVKGKVYGLEEAVKVAQETMCSACSDPGATLGCFFKGCPNKYHYRCALESDCVLIEENFSMKCKKHKNKTFKAPPGSRWDDR